MSSELESNGTHNSVGGDDKSRRHPRWTRQETLTLIQAKEITENSPHKGRKITSLTSVENNNSEPKWVMISSYCKKQGVKRGPAQCRKRWSNLIGDFKKVKLWEAKVKNGEGESESGDSFWSMRNDVRKENKLPVSFDVEVFKVLEGRESGSVGAVSPLPLQVVAAGGGCDEVEEEGGDDVMDDEMVNNDDGVDVKDGVLLSGVKDDVLLSGVKDDVLLSDVKEDVLLSGVKGAEQKVQGLEWKEEEVQKNDDSVTVTESPVQNVCSSEHVSAGSEEHHHQAFQEPNNNSKQDTATNATRTPEPEISNRDSQENVKRRRLSTDDHKANSSEKQILQVLEANNKLLNAQLNNHNKDCQLDREQRKEISNALVTTLNKLTDVLVKIAEKL